MNLDKPALPRDWYQPSVLGLCCLLGSTAAWILGFGYLSMLVVDSGLTWWTQALLLMPTTLLTAHGLHMAGWVAHEGVHLSLLSNKHWSVGLGIVVGGVALFPTIGYGLNHWSHHRYTNGAKDPDTYLFSRQRTFWQRVFLSRLLANRAYVRNTFRAATGQPLEHGSHMPFRKDWVRRFAWLTLVSIAAWGSVYLALALCFPRYALAWVVLPLLAAVPMTGLRPFFEHGGLGAEPFQASRSYAAPVWTCLLFGNNLHLEHHLYPSVPCYRLSKVHRLLQDGGYFERHQAAVEPGFFEPFRTLSSQVQYPSAETRQRNRPL